MINHDIIFNAIIHRLALEYFRLYYVDIHTDTYIEYDPSAPNFDIDHEKTDFFMVHSRSDAPELHPEDADLFYTSLKKENVLHEINEHGEFSVIYRVMSQNEYLYSQMKGTRIEGDHDHIIVSVKNIDADVKREQEYLNNLARAREAANRDGLTGVKNKRAYFEYVSILADEIQSGEVTEYAIVVFDINELKLVNDTLGHQAGDRYIKEACKIICDVFNRSPVFRIGGDEFAVIATGHDYEHLDFLMDEIAMGNKKNAGRSGIVIAAGMARSKGGKDIKAVFESADERMYENKKKMKEI